MLPKGLLVTGVMLTIAGLSACFQGPRESGTTSHPETNPPIETPSSSEEGNGSGPQGHQESHSVITKVIPPEGGTVELEGVAQVNFPAGAFESPQPVTVFTTNTPETEAAQINWNWSSDSPTPPLSYDVRINSGDVGPVTVFEVVLTVPDDYLSEVPPGDTPHVFAQVVGGGSLENLDFYQVLASEFDAGAKEVRAQVPLYAIRTPRVDDGTIEVIVVVGSAPQ